MIMRIVYTGLGRFERQRARIFAQIDIAKNKVLSGLVIFTLERERCSKAIPAPFCVLRAAVGSTQFQLGVEQSAQLSSPRGCRSFCIGEYCDELNSTSRNS